MSKDCCIDNLRISDSYRLSLLKAIDNDDLSELFNTRRTLYINNIPTKTWHEYNNITEIANYSCNKFEKFINLMGKDVKVLSFTRPKQNIISAPFVESNRITHLGSKSKNKWINLFLMFVEGVVWSIRHRNVFDQVCVHNYMFPMYAVAKVCSLILKKKLIVDFQDDYFCINKKNTQSILFEKIFRKFSDDVIVINRKMERYFNHSQKIFVFNGFIKLDYDMTLKPDGSGMYTFLVSGTLDYVRGVHLIPMVAKAFQALNFSYKIYVCGMSGEADINKSNHVEYLGFLSDYDYIQLVKQVSACLVLQLPDHEFNAGSFPSKIESYSLHKKPIFVVNEILH